MWPFRKRQPDPLPQAERFELALSGIKTQVVDIARSVKELSTIFQKAMLVAANDRQRIESLLELAQADELPGEANGEIDRLATTENGACPVGTNSRLAAG